MRAIAGERHRLDKGDPTASCIYGSRCRKAMNFFLLFHCWEVLRNGRERWMLNFVAFTREDVRVVFERVLGKDF